MIELCPCCGSRADTHLIEGFRNHSFTKSMWTDDAHWVECTNRDCKLATKQHKSKAEAIAAWNRRVK